MTVICVLVACLFPADGYDSVLARAFQLPGLRFQPGARVPAASAFSQARKLLGEQAMRRIFELDAERVDAELGITALWKGLEVTAKSVPFKTVRELLTAPSWSCCTSPAI
ncbi:MAG TPA: transposase domain-containing protein [Trebonia sp.]